MQGTMLWFNLDKGHGLIRTGDDERLYVAPSGFSPGHRPEREDGGESPRAPKVSFVDRADPPRARLSTARSGHEL